MASPDREKALEMALANIDKSFGKGSVMRLGDEVRPAIQVIPTGSIALDIALGIGGLPRGRVVEIYGPESSGKCLTADTYVWTARGLETVAELFARAGLEASCTSRVTDVRGLGLRAVNERGELEGVAALTHNNCKPVQKVTLASGRTVTGTHNHPLRVVGEQGSVVWRTIAELRVGDSLVSGAFGAVEAAEGDGLSEDLAVLLGYLLAEGSLTQSNAIRFTTTDADVAADYQRLVGSLFPGLEVRCQNGQDYDIAAPAGLPDVLAIDYGLELVSAHDKTVPHLVRTAGDKSQRVFLAALFEGGGRLDTSTTVGLETASEELARQVQLLLQGLGVASSLLATWRADHQRNYWSVTVNPASTDCFLAEVGFRSPRPATQVVASSAAPTRDTEFESGSRVAGLLADRCTHECIVSIEDGGRQPTFDLMLPGTSSFLANGVLSHNTTVALHAVANAQAAGGIAAFIDAEHALDPEYAKALGVDTDGLLVSQPDTGEQALEIADMLVRSGALDIIVIDSVAALVPRAEIEGEMGDNHVGLQARLMSQALRKMTGALSNTGTTAIFINQLREKIGVMFGCFDHGTQIVLGDGSRMAIGDIVENKLDVEVLSYDPVTQQVVPRRVINWFDNGPTPSFLEITVADNGLSGPAAGPSTLAVTANHLIRTPGGWVEAGELVAGDRVMVSQPHLLSDQQWQVILGGLMGSGALSWPVRQSHVRASYRMGHDAQQIDYLDWKVSMLANIGQRRSTDAKGAAFVELTPLAELAPLREAVYFGDGCKHLSFDYLKALTPLALAVWYLDDGTFGSPVEDVPEATMDASGRSEICVQGMSPDSQRRLLAHLRDTFGLLASHVLKGAQQQACFRFSLDETAKLHELVAPYIHPSMQDKLLERFRGQFAVEPAFVEPTLLPVPAPVLEVKVKAKQDNMNRYDIEVAGTHNYLADGVVVHNSPETTTGGKALKFYSSVRIDVRRIETLKEGGDAVGNRTRAKVVKNKMAPPFKQAEFDIIYGQGISREGSLIDVGVDQGIVRKSGAWYTYEGDQLGQGKENSRAFLRDNPDLADEIEKRIKEKLLIGPQPDADELAPVPFGLAEPGPVDLAVPVPADV